MIDVFAAVQTAAHAIYVEPLTDLLLKSAALIIIGLQGWQIRTTRKIEDMLNKWSVVLFGINGDNGMQSDVTELKRQMADMGIHPHRRKDD